MTSPASSPQTAGPYLEPEDPHADPVASGGSHHATGEEAGEHADADLPALRERIATCWPDPMDAPPLRWGIIAPGGIGRRFATEVAQYTRGRVVAVGSRSLQRAQAFAAEFDTVGGLPGQDPAPPRAYGSYAELVADPEVEAVYVASPHSHHHEHALLALRAGKHVLVEKAFTRSVAEAREVFDEAAARGLFAMEAMWTRFLPHQHALREVIAAGVLGEILAVRADHSQRLTHVERLMAPELAGGALLDLTVYPLSFIHDVLGAPPTGGVHTQGMLTDTGVDGNEVVTLNYAPDRPRTLAVATAMLWGRGRTEAEIVGERARVDMRGRFYRSNASMVVSDVQDNVLVRFPGDLGEEATQGGFQHEAAEVARCVAAGALQSEIMSWQDTLEILAITDAARQKIGVVYPGE